MPATASVAAGWAKSSAATGPAGNAEARGEGGGASHGGVHASSAGSDPGNVRAASRVRSGSSSEAWDFRVVIRSATTAAAPVRQPPERVGHRLYHERRQPGTGSRAWTKPLR